MNVFGCNIRSRRDKGVSEDFLRGAIFFLKKNYLKGGRLWKNKMYLSFSVPWCLTTES